MIYKYTSFIIIYKLNLDRFIIRYSNSYVLVASTKIIIPGIEIEHVLKITKVDSFDN